MKNYRNADGINLVIGWCYPVEPGGERERERDLLLTERGQGTSHDQDLPTLEARRALS
jgi:hypothetical protein